MEYPPELDIISILGPTASGKTSLAVALAHLLGTEIISADSRQVYRRMDLGTGKDLEDYIINGHAVPYHLIDTEEPGTKYNLYRYQHDFFETLGDMRSRGLRPVVCGGTGLYLESIIRSYNISHVPQNPALRAELEGQSLEALTALLAELKARSGQAMHNTTDVDTAKRAIPSIVKCAVSASPNVYTNVSKMAWSQKCKTSLTKAFQPKISYIMVWNTSFSPSTAQDNCPTKRWYSNSKQPYTSLLNAK